MDRQADTLSTSGTEQGQDIAGHASEIADRCREVLAVHRASFIERYIQADGHIAIRRVGPRAAKHGFLIKAAPIGHRDLPAQSGVKAYSSWKNEGVQESAVFPGQVEIMEGAKQGVAVRSGVWLQRFDNVLTDLGKPLYLFERSGVAVGHELVLAFPKGKIGAGGIWEAVSGGQRASEQIQAASDAVDDGPCLRVNDGVEGSDITEAIELFSRLRIGIYSDGVGLAAPPSCDTFFQNWELGHGPIDCSFRV